jgi:SAM-dependent methyltransferase
VNRYLLNNRQLWNEYTDIHKNSDFYDLKGFLAGKSSLQKIELEELGEVVGKTLLHLQCHFGMDTLSWARRGAVVTGVDFSERAIALAESIRDELKLSGRFICSDINSLQGKLTERFDVVYTSYGVLCWLPDLTMWADTIAAFLEPGGVFYIVEGHPFLHVFDDAENAAPLTIRYSYFHTREPTRWEPEGSYADPDAVTTCPSYEWTHSLSDIINALISAGLQIEYVHEFPFCFYKAFPFLEDDGQGRWRVKGGNKTIPMLFSLRASKPATPAGI